MHTTCLLVMLTEPLHRGYYSSTHYTLSLFLSLLWWHEVPATRADLLQHCWSSPLHQVVDVDNHFHFVSLYSGGVDSLEIWFAVQ